MTGEAAMQQVEEPDGVFDAATAQSTRMLNARVNMTAIFRESLSGFITLTSEAIAEAMRAEADKVAKAHDESIRLMADKVQPFFTYLGQVHDSAANMRRIMNGEPPLDANGNPVTESSADADLLFMRGAESLRNSISTCLLVLEQRKEGAGHLIDLVQAPGQNTPVLMQALTDLHEAIHKLYPAPPGRDFC